MALEQDIKVKRELQIVKSELHNRGSTIPNADETVKYMKGFRNFLAEQLPVCFRHRCIHGSKSK